MERQATGRVFTCNCSTTSETGKAQGAAPVHLEQDKNPGKDKWDAN